MTYLVTYWESYGSGGHAADRRARRLRMVYADADSVPVCEDQRQRAGLGGAAVVEVHVCSSFGKSG